MPRIIKRTSNISVEPQYGSDSSFRIKKKKPVIQTNKRQSGIDACVVVVYFLFLYFFGCSMV